MMCPTIRPALGWVLGLAGVVVSVSATAPPSPSQPAGKPKAKVEMQPATQAKPPASQPADEAASQPEAAGEDASVRTPAKVSAEEVLKAFQKERPTQVPITPSGGPEELAPLEGAAPAGAGRRLPDGFFLVDRVGRAVKEGGWYVFVFEGYNESHPEPPMRLLPNQLLERMVTESGGATNSTVFIVSGEVTEFQNENYLLLRKLLRRRSLGNLEK
jgi:hypothetical protein